MSPELEKVAFDKPEDKNTRMVRSVDCSHLLVLVEYRSLLILIIRRHAQSSAIMPSFLSHCHLASCN